MTLSWILATLAAVLILGGLSFYLGRLLWLIKQQQLKQQQVVEAKNANLIESIVLIAKAMREEQCELSEGALRLWVLLDHLQLPEKPDAVHTYPGLFKMYDVIKDMPTHQARKERDKKEIRHLDHIREQAEIDLKADILADVHKLLAFFQNQK
ncbi:DUF2489 domain-containing protein [Rheinheimera sp. 1928-s]|uniref:DUF2489 domain-containing protein n=1 Tax=Rheinheimera sp. 1928-s TaxID=3033803 RepID=UPI00261A88DD|nr:DUF2489 domain-containing protein [Rheinheimera sp. 1928-s]MDF3125113.1 DUF2489 domain-containing protein [Rheinheimera sp. 1928-s]